MLTKKFFFLSFFLLLISVGAEEILLPEPEYKGSLSLEECIFKRKSLRQYRREPLNLKDVSQLLWAGAGITCDGVTGPTRSYPSAGACYPLKLYIVVGEVIGLKPGIYLYYPEKHILKLLKRGDYRKKLAWAAWNQGAIIKAPVSLVFTAVAKRTIQRYGKRGQRYIYMDVGGAGQTVSLIAESLGCGSVIIGAFVDALVKKVLELKNEQPLYIIPVGKKLEKK